MTRQTETVKSFNDAKGLASSRLGGKDVFVHINAIQVSGYGCVPGTCCNVTERINTNGCVVDASSVIRKRLKVDGRVVAAIGLVEAGKRSIGLVLEHSGV
jgi:hypothetical protein